MRGGDSFANIVASRHAMDVIAGQVQIMFADLRETKAFMLKFGAEAAPGKPNNLAQMLVAEFKRWAAVVKAAGIRLE